MTSAVRIPVVVDAGAGYGEPLHVMRTVRELERAGAAGMHIEDQIYPKRVHYRKGVELERGLSVAERFAPKT